MKWLSDQQMNAAYNMAARGFIDHNKNCEMGLEYIYQMTLDEIERFEMMSLEGLIDTLEDYSAAYHADDKQHYPRAWHIMGVKLTTLKAYICTRCEVMS
jgi:hypothetical protein